MPEKSNFAKTYEANNLSQAATDGGVLDIQCVPRTQAKKLHKASPLAIKLRGINSHTDDSSAAKPMLSVPRKSRHTTSRQSTQGSPYLCDPAASHFSCSYSHAQGC